MSHSLSPEQKVAFESIISLASSNIKYFDIDTAFQAVFQVILQSVNDQKKILIQLPSDKSQSDVVLRLLNQYGLNGLTINLDRTNPIPESDIVTLRSVVKKDPDTKPIIENILAKEKLNSSLAKTIRYFEALDSPVLSNNSFRDFAASSILKESQEKSSLLIDNQNVDFKLELSAQEFYKIKRAIKIASESYHKEFDLFDQINIVNNVVWTYDQDKLEKTRETLENLNHEGKELLKSYYETSSNLEIEATKDISSNISQLLSTVKTNREECTSHHINETYKRPNKGNKFSLFSKKEKVNPNAIYVASFDAVSKIIKDISSDWYDDLPAPQTEEITYAYISKFLTKCIEDAPEYVKKINLSRSTSIHRINRLNTSSDAVTVLDKKLTSFITKIEKLGIIQHKYNTNTISFTKQMQICKQISQVLDQCYSIIGKESSYTKWKTEEKANEQITNLLISELKAFPKSQWSVQFELWYNDQIKNSIMSDLTIKQNDVELLRLINKSILKSEISAITNKLQLKRINAANTLKSTSKELFNTLFKKKTINLNYWSDIALTARQFLLDFFPIHTITNIETTGEYDVVISFNRKPNDENNSLPVHYLSPITPQDIDEISKGDDVFLYLNTYNYYSPLSELTNSEKLKAAKKLAKFILSLNQQVKIYQLKTGNIISLLPANDDAEFENKMEQYGIKSIETAGALYDKLTESILFTNRQPYLLIKDELINPELHQHLIWQADLLETFKTAGYKVLSLNTDKQLIDNDLAFQSFLDPLTENSRIETSSKTSSSTSSQQMESTAEL